MLSRPNRSKDTLRDRILHVLSGAPIPMDVENVRIKSGLKNWESTKALLLELVVEGIISGQKTTKSWVFWIDHTDTRMSIAGRNHAWSTGLLSALLVQNPVPKESMNFENFAFNTNNMNLTLNVRNTGSVAIAFASYYVKDSNGNQYARLSWPTDNAGKYPAAVNPNGLISVNIAISSACGSSCTGATYQFSSGLSYTVTLVTTRNNQFVWQGTR